MRHNFVAFALMVVLLQGTALGQNQENGSAFGPEAGDWEVTLGGGGSNDQDFDVGDFNLNGSIGYYLTDAWQISLRQGIGFSDFGDSSWNASTRAALDYHFDLDRFQPFVGANAGAFYGDDVAETGAAGLEAGLKYFVKEETFLFGRAEYQWLFEDADDVEDTFESGRFIYTVGIGFTF